MASLPGDDGSDRREESLIDAALQEACGSSGEGDPKKGEDAASLRSVEVTRLQMPQDDPSTQSVSAAIDQMGRRIAHYHVKRTIATGGMGTVYEATQESPHRTVAIKVMRDGVTSARALRRFEYESQVLARLHHPGIAHVYEAGWHDDGEQRVPYFAMEYIPNARSILKYANQKRLSTRERIVLFTKVCEGVHHGHQRGVIHRDLKPGNILIDAQKQVKVIDFGVARATDADMSVTTLHTSVGEMVGTLKYMSPEQCQADPNDLDIRSDIYSLGVVLYELLSGKLPYDLQVTPMAFAAQVICEEPPTRLSSLDRSLRGDLETIVEKALEKDRRRRYQSALALAEDLQRYLSDEPILARPPGTVYRLRKLFRRRRVSVALTGLVLAIAVYATVREVRTYGLRQEQERLAWMLEVNVGLFDFDDSPLAISELISFHSQPLALSDMYSACNRLLALDPDNARALAIRGRVSFRRGDAVAAERDAHRALALQPDNRLALRTLAFALMSRGEWSKARTMYEKALKGYEMSTDLPRDFHNRARLRRMEDEYDAALQDHDRAVAFSPDMPRVIRGRGITHYMKGDTDGAIRDFKRAAVVAIEEGKERSDDEMASSAVQCYLWIWEIRSLRNEPGDREAAARALDLAEQAAQPYPLARDMMAVWRGRKNADEYLRSLARRPDDQAQVHYYLGVQALVEGRRHEAVNHFNVAANPVLNQWEEFDLARWHLRRLGTL